MKRRKRVLIVDDDAHVLFVLQQALARLGEIEVLLASNGYDALQAVFEGGLDLLITDIRLPGLDGFELTRALRARGKAVPVIWISAHDDPETGALVRELGVYRYLEKPLEIDEIRAVVQSALEQAERDSTAWQGRQ